MKKRSQWWALLCMLMLILGGVVSAEAKPEGSDDSEDGETPKTLEEYVKVDVSAIPQANTIATKLPTDLQTTPANVGTVSSELFREQQAANLSDVLLNVSGLNVQAQNGVQDFFLIRGFDSLSGGLVLIDGAPVPEATYYPTYNVEGVEVLKGPGGFLYGSDPLAGVVNIVRKQPVQNDFLGVELTGGSFGTYQGNVDWNISNEENLSFRLNGFYRESEGYRNGFESDHWAINPSLTWNINDRSSLNINVERVEANYTPDSGLPLINGAIPMVPRDRSYQSILDFSEQEINRFQVDYQIALNDRVTLRNKSYYRELDWDTLGTLLSQNFASMAPSVSRVANTLLNEQKVFGNQFEAVVRLGGDRIKHTLLAGVEIAQRDNDYGIDFGFLSPLDLVNPVDMDTSVALSPFQSGSAESKIIAPYIVDQIEFSPKFHLSLGLRYDDIDFENSVSDFGFPAVDSSRSDGDFSPRAGFLWAPNRSLSIYANAAQSFAPPSARVVGSLDPEDSEQIELGVKKKFANGKVQTTFALFELDRTNIAIPDNNGFTQQQGDQRSRGFEFELAAEPAEGLHTFISYSFTDAELTRFAELIQTGPMTFTVFDRSGNDPAFVPENLFNAWVSKDLGENWGIGGGARFIDSQYISESNAFEIDDALLFDAAVFYKGDGYRVNLNFKNITDEEYEVRGFGSDSVIPAAPFAVYATIGFNL